MKQIKSYMFEAGDILYYVDKQGEVYSFEVTEDMLEHKSEMPAAFLDDYVFKPYAPVTVYDDMDDYGCGQQKAIGLVLVWVLDLKLNIQVKLLMFLLLKKKHLNLAKFVNEVNEENKFFNSYSKIEIKHAVSNRVLNTLTFTKYSLVELLKLVNIYRTENTPIKIFVIDYDGNEFAYSEIEKNQKDFIEMNYLSICQELEESK